MLIFGPAAAPTISAVIWYPLTLAGALITVSASTTRTAASVMLEPTSPESLSTFRTSSTDTFSCRPPARTIAYTRELSLPRACPRESLTLARNGVPTTGSPELPTGVPGARVGHVPGADALGYQSFCTRQ